MRLRSNLRKKDKAMELVTERDLASSLSTTWQRLERDGAIAVASQGKVKAIMLSVNEENFDETIRGVRQVEALRHFWFMRAKAEKSGFLSDEEIEAEIQAAKAEIAKQESLH
jgi:hypothetical protein